MNAISGSDIKMEITTKFADKVTSLSGYCHNHRYGFEVCFKFNEYDNKSE